MISTKKRILLFVLFTLQINTSFSQNIYSALHLNENREFKTKAPKKIIEKNTFYTLNGSEKNTNIKTFNSYGLLILEERYDKEGNLKAKLEYKTDDENKLNLLELLREEWEEIEK